MWHRIFFFLPIFQIPVNYIGCPVPEEVWLATGSGLHQPDQDNRITPYYSIAAQYSEETAQNLTDFIVW